MKICRAEINMLKIRNYCREYPVIPANLNHLLLLYEPTDKTSYAYGLQGSTVNRAAVNFQSYRRKKGFICTTFLILVFFALLAITPAYPGPPPHMFLFKTLVTRLEVPWFEHCLAQLRPWHNCLGGGVHLSLKLSTLVPSATVKISTHGGRDHCIISQSSIPQIMAIFINFSPEYEICTDRRYTTNS